MKVPYDESVARHIGPESCAVVREGGGEALTGVHTGRPSTREIPTFGCRRCYPTRKATSPSAISRVLDGPGAVVDPSHVWKLLARKPGDLMNVPQIAWDRVEQTKVVMLR